MIQPVINCVKCEGFMEEGFVMDRMHGGALPSNWVSGEPVSSFWTGTKLTGKTQYRVKTFRCARCGYLESYALEENY